jgi:hypothetical protein
LSRSAIIACQASQSATIINSPAARLLILIDAAFSSKLSRHTGEHHLCRVVRQNDDRLHNLRLHQIHRPGDGTSESKANTSDPAQ